MAELLCSRYIPIEMIVVKGKERTFKDFLKEGYSVKKCGNGIYQLTKPPILEMVFQEGERDYIFDMLDEAYRYYGKSTISSLDASRFALLLANKEIKISIFPDGTYTLK